MSERVMTMLLHVRRVKGQGIKYSQAVSTLTDEEATAFAELVGLMAEDATEACAAPAASSAASSLPSTPPKAPPSEALVAIATTPAAARSGAPAAPPRTLDARGPGARGEGRWGGWK